MELRIYSTPQETISALAGFLIQMVNDALAEKGECAVVLSGGNSPKRLYELLASPLYSQQADWGKVYFFFGDERYVPFTSPDNNGYMASQSLFEPLGIGSDHIYYIDTSLPPQEAAADYSEKILSHFKGRPVRFDLILLGLGDNAHTASLFPYTPILKEEKLLVGQVFLEGQQSYRITCMTAPLINSARAIVFLVYGQAKALAVQQVLKGEKDIEAYPAQLIEEGSNTYWFLDDGAAGEGK